MPLNGVPVSFRPKVTQGALSTLFSSLCHPTKVVTMGSSTAAAKLKNHGEFQLAPLNSKPERREKRLG